MMTPRAMLDRLFAICMLPMLLVTLPTGKLLEAMPRNTIGKIAEEVIGILIVTPLMALTMLFCLCVFYCIAIVTVIPYGLVVILLGGDPTR